MYVNTKFLFFLISHSLSSGQNIQHTFMNKMSSQLRDFNRIIMLYHSYLLDVSHWMIEITARKFHLAALLALLNRNLDTTIIK